MSEWTLDGVGESFEIAPHLHLMVYHLDAKERVLWQIAAIDDALGFAHVVESKDESLTEGAAEIAGLEAALALAEQIRSRAQGELSRLKRAAQDAADAALVAAAGEIAWEVRDAGFAVLHTACVAGTPCCVEAYPEGRVKWEHEPEHYGHPHTWEAPDVETAKTRAAAAALRSPCKRWRVTIPKQAMRPFGRTEGGTVEVWAHTSEGALYRAAQALSVAMIGGRGIEGEAVEIAADGGEG